MFDSRDLTMLDFPEIQKRLAEGTRTAAARTRALALKPFEEAKLREQAAALIRSARRIYDAMGAPPIYSMEGLDGLSDAIRLGQVLGFDALEGVSALLKHARLLKRYLERGFTIDNLVGAFGGSIDPADGLRGELERCLAGDRLHDSASPHLKALRERIGNTRERIRDKLSGFLSAHPEWFQESFYTTRGSRFALPVKREHRNKVKGSVLDASSSGATVFIEPEAVAQLQNTVDLLSVDEENEVLRILAELSAMVAEHASAIFTDRDVMEEVDFLFAAGRLGSEMKGVTAQSTPRRELKLVNARHPLLGEGAVPMSIELGGVRALVITGPNTGGKTVALKTVGLLSLMALCGLQVPAESAVIPQFSGVYADIGDGQSIAQSLSTFSSHAARVITILERADGRSLALLDELGAGTDPQEGMGLAIAVLEELNRRGMLMVVTSHYAQIKDFAARTPGFVNARMTFDRVSLSPTYRLEIGRAGESCALYIAKRLGMPMGVVERAFAVAYPDGEGGSIEDALPDSPAEAPPVEADMPVVEEKTPDAPAHWGDQFKLGDSVLIPYLKQSGIIARERSARGELVVRVQGKNITVQEKRIKPFLKKEELYPSEDYDLNIVLRTWDERKQMRDVGKGKQGAQFEVRE